MIKTTFKYKSFKFPAGEKQIRIESINPVCESISLFYENDEELFEVALLNNAIKHMHAKCKVYFKMYYTPYARQDRVCYSGEAFSLEVLANFINSMNFAQVMVVDPHSDKVYSLIRNCEVRNWWLNDLAKIVPNNTLLVAPDKGASKKIEYYARFLNKDFIVADKVRNPDNGFITGYYVPEFDTSKYDCILVLDDICDGGATFNILGDNINHPNKWLFVSHGIFSKGTEELRKRYSKIMTTDSLVSAGKNNPEVLFHCEEDMCAIDPIKDNRTLKELKKEYM
jgi:ribose-phosphate pyrophosphokinase